MTDRDKLVYKHRKNALNIMARAAKLAIKPLKTKKAKNKRASMLIGLALAARSEMIQADIIASQPLKQKDFESGGAIVGKIKEEILMRNPSYNLP